MLEYFELDDVIRRIPEISPIVSSIRRLAPIGSFCFIGGSIAEGFENGRSDIDIYIESSIGLPNGDLFKHSISRSMQIETFNRCDIYPVLDSIRFDPLNHPKIPFKENDLFYRFLRGVHFGSTDQLSAGFRKECLEAYCMYSGATFFIEASNAYDDLLGNIEQKDEYLTVYSNAMRLVDNIFDAYLAVKGDPLPRTKWRFKKANRTLGASDLAHCLYKQIFITRKVASERALLLYIDAVFELYVICESHVVKSFHMYKNRYIAER